MEVSPVPVSGSQHPEGMAMASSSQNRLGPLGRFHSDLRSGHAGWIIRSAASVATAMVLVAFALIALGIMEISGAWVRDHHIAMGLCMAGLVWCCSLIFLWKGFRRGQRAIRTLFTIVAIWFVIIPLCVFVEATASREELVIAGLIVLGFGLTFFAVGLSTYRALGGSKLADEAGEVRVNCPSCSYSLVGLSSSNCPECGWVGTIDRLIELQDYGAIRAEQAEQRASSQDDTFDDADLLEDD